MSYSEKFYSPSNLYNRIFLQGLITIYVKATVIQQADLELFHAKKKKNYVRFKINF